MNYDKRYCAECGQELVQYKDPYYPKQLWVACPEYTKIITGLRDNSWMLHDKVYLGSVQPKYNTVTGEKL